MLERPLRSLSVTSRPASSGSVAPAGAVAFSPVTDLALTGESFATRAEADRPLLHSTAGRETRPRLSRRRGSQEPVSLASLRESGRIACNPYSRWRRRSVARRLATLCRTRRRGRRRCNSRHLDGMPHGFINGVGKLDAAAQALAAVGSFLKGRLQK